MATFNVRAEKVRVEDVTGKAIAGDEVTLSAESADEAKILFLESHPVSGIVPAVEWRFIYVGKV